MSEHRGLKVRTQGPTCTARRAIAALPRSCAYRRGETDWKRIAALYQQLGEISPSPIIELNRAVAIGMAYGPAAGLEIADALNEEPSLAAYHRLPAVRADLLFKLGRLAEARREFERAAALTENTQERNLLLTRASECSNQQ